jgi:hypothetical protein
MLWSAVPIASLAFAFILFDTWGDSEGWRAAIPLTMMMLVIPTVLLLLRWFITKQMKSKDESPPKSVDDLSSVGTHDRDGEPERMSPLDSADLSPSPSLYLKRLSNLIERKRSSVARNTRRGASRETNDLPDFDERSTVELNRITIATSMSSIRSFSQTPHLSVVEDESNLAKTRRPQRLQSTSARPTEISSDIQYFNNPLRKPDR